LRASFLTNFTMKETYFISYDLMNDKDYKTLSNELEKLGAERVLLSLWCLKKSNTSAEKLRDHIGGFIDNDDKIVVIKSATTYGWASRGELLFNPNSL